MKKIHILFGLFFFGMTALLSCGEDNTGSGPVNPGNVLFTLEGSWASYESGDVFKKEKTEVLIEPDDPEFPNQWNMHMMRVQHIWNITMGDPNVRVTVISDGFNGGVDDFADTSIDPSDEEGVYTQGADEDFGTHNCGVIAQSTNNGIGCVGMAPKVTINPVRIFCPFTGTDSWECGFYIPHTSTEYTTTAIAEGSDVILLNEGFDDPSFEAQWQTILDGDVAVFNPFLYSQEYNIIFSPGKWDRCFTVGGINKAKEVTATSSYEGQLDFVAPSGVKEDLDDDGVYDEVVQQTISGPSYHSGTGVAAAHAAALGALIKSVKPDVTIEEMDEAIKKTAEDVGTFGPDEKSGAGLINPVAALHYVQGHNYLVTNTVENTGTSLDEPKIYTLRVFTGEIALEITSPDGTTYRMTLLDPDDNEVAQSTDNQLSYISKYLSGEYTLRISTLE